MSFIAHELNEQIAGGPKPPHHASSNTLYICPKDSVVGESLPVHLLTDTLEGESLTPRFSKVGVQKRPPCHRPIAPSIDDIDDTPICTAVPLSGGRGPSDITGKDIRPGNHTKIIITPTFDDDSDNDGREVVVLSLSYEAEDAVNKATAALEVLCEQQKYNYMPVVSPGERNSPYRGNKEYQTRYPPIQEMLCKYVPVPTNNISETEENKIDDKCQSDTYDNFNPIVYGAPLIISEVNRQVKNKESDIKSQSYTGFSEDNARDSCGIVGVAQNIDEVSLILPSSLCKTQCCYHSDEDTLDVPEVCLKSSEDVQINVSPSHASSGNDGSNEDGSSTAQVSILRDIRRLQVELLGGGISDNVTKSGVTRIKGKNKVKDSHATILVKQLLKEPHESRMILGGSKSCNANDGSQRDIISESDSMMSSSFHCSRHGSYSEPTSSRYREGINEIIDYNIVSKRFLKEKANRIKYYTSAATATNAPINSTIKSEFIKDTTQSQYRPVMESNVVSDPSIFSKEMIAYNSYIRKQRLKNDMKYEGTGFKSIRAVCDGHEESTKVKKKRDAKEIKGTEFDIVEKYAHVMVPPNCERKIVPATNIILVRNDHVISETPQPLGIAFSNNCNDLSSSQTEMWDSSVMSSTIQQPMETALIASDSDQQLCITNHSSLLSAEQKLNSDENITVSTLPTTSNTQQTYASYHSNQKWSNTDSAVWPNCESSVNGVFSSINTKGTNDLTGRFGSAAVATPSSAAKSLPPSLSPLDPFSKNNAPTGEKNETNLQSENIQTCHKYNRSSDNDKEMSTLHTGDAILVSNERSSIQESGQKYRKNRKDNNFEKSEKETKKIGGSRITISTNNSLHCSPRNSNKDGVGEVHVPKMTQECQENEWDRTRIKDPSNLSVVKVLLERTKHNHSQRKTIPSNNVIGPSNHPSKEFKKLVENVVKVVEQQRKVKNQRDNSAKQTPFFNRIKEEHNVTPEVPEEETTPRRPVTAIISGKKVVIVPKTLLGRLGSNQKPMISKGRTPLSCNAKSGEELLMRHIKNRNSQEREGCLTRKYQRDSILENGAKDSSPVFNAQSRGYVAVDSIHRDTTRMSLQHQLPLQKLPQQQDEDFIFDANIKMQREGGASLIPQRRPKVSYSSKVIDDAADDRGYANITPYFIHPVASMASYDNKPMRTSESNETFLNSPRTQKSSKQHSQSPSLSPTLQKGFKHVIESRVTPFSRTANYLGGFRSPSLNMNQNKSGSVQLVWISSRREIV